MGKVPKKRPGPLAKRGGGFFAPDQGNIQDERRLQVIEAGPQSPECACVVGLADHALVGAHESDTVVVKGSQDLPEKCSMLPVNLWVPASASCPAWHSMQGGDKVSIGSILAPRGQMKPTVESAKTVTGVLRSPTTRSIWRRLFGSLYA